MADPQRLGSAPEPSAGLGRRIAAEIAAERRSARRRRRFNFGLAIGPAAAAAAAAFVFLVLPGGSSEPSQRVDFASLPPGMQISAALEPRSFGTQISMQVSGRALRHALPGLPAPRRRRPGRSRHLPLPLRRRLRRGAQLCPRSLPGRVDRGACRQPAPSWRRSRTRQPPNASSHELQKGEHMRQVSRPMFRFGGGARRRAALVVAGCGCSSSDTTSSSSGSSGGGSLYGSSGGGSSTTASSQSGGSGGATAGRWRRLRREHPEARQGDRQLEAASPSMTSTRTRARSRPATAAARRSGHRCRAAVRRRPRAAPKHRSWAPRSGPTAPPR